MKTLKQMWPWVLMIVISAPGAIKALMELHEFLKEAFRD